MKPTPHPTRRGFNLVEVLLATAFLAAVLTAGMQLFAVTQKQVSSSEALLHSGILAQMVVERIKSNVAMNPRWFRDVLGSKSSWTSRGSVVDPSLAVVPGQTQSPFFTHLFSKGTTDLYDPINSASLTPPPRSATASVRDREIQSLFEAFRDYEVRVEIHDDLKLTPQDPAGTAAAIVKRVKVGVSRLTITSAGKVDPLECVITARIPTPAESLSADELDTVASGFDGQPLERQWQEFLFFSAENPYVSSPQLGDDSRHVLADAFMVLAASNNEALQTEGRAAAGSNVVGAGTSADFLDAWIARMSGSIAVSSSKRAVAKLQIRKTGVLMDSYRRMRLPLVHLVRQVMGPAGPDEPVVDRVNRLRRLLDASVSMLNAIQARISRGMGAARTARDPAAARNALRIMKSQYSGLFNRTKTELTKDAETVLLVSLLQQFYAEPRYAPVNARPGTYPARIRQILDDTSATLCSHLDQPTGVTPYEKLMAALTLADVTALRQIERGALDGAMIGRLDAIAEREKLHMREFSSGLTGGELRDLSALRTRHPRLTARVAEMQDFCPRYTEMLTLFTANGTVMKMLSLRTRFLEALAVDNSQLFGSLNQMLATDGAGDIWVEPAVLPSTSIDPFAGGGGAFAQ